MSKATVHAESSARRFGGKASDYLALHEFLDSSKSVIADNRHRVLYHHAFAIGPDGILEKVFGKTITNSDGKEVSVRDIGEQHCREDFGGHIPTLQDYIGCMSLAPFMNGQGRPPSAIRPEMTAVEPPARDLDGQEIIMHAAGRGYQLVAYVGGMIVLQPMEKVSD